MADPEANCLALRKVSDTIRSSIHANFLWGINKLQLNDYFDTKVSPAEFVHKDTGQLIMLKGLDKAEKLKSLKFVNGYCKYLWFEELSEFTNAEEIRNVKQSALRGGEDEEEYVVNPDHKPISFASYNPPDDIHNWVNLEAEKKVRGRLVHHSDYLAVPPHWLGKRFITDAETLKEEDYDKYRHEYLGEVVGLTEKIVFAGKWEIKEFEVDNNWDGPYNGMDFGFSNDPNVVCILWIDWENKRIYVEYAKYGHHTETDDLPELIRTIPGMKTAYQTKVIEDKETGKRIRVLIKDDSGNPIHEDCELVIRCDIARPETISYLKRHGFSGAIGAKKGKGSVEDGISFLRSFHWIFHTRCEEATEEAKYYSYKVNRAGDVLTDLGDKFNHFWDSARYALNPLIRQRDIGEVVVGPSTTGGMIGEVIV